MNEIASSKPLRSLASAVWNHLYVFISSIGVGGVRASPGKTLVQKEYFR
jgi:hypothetical protein